MTRLAAVRDAKRRIVRLDCARAAAQLDLSAAIADARTSGATLQQIADAAGLSVARVHQLAQQHEAPAA